MRIHASKDDDVEKDLKSWTIFNFYIWIFNSRLSFLKPLQSYTLLIYKNEVYKKIEARWIDEIEE